MNIIEYALFLRMENRVLRKLILFHSKTMNCVQTLSIFIQDEPVYYKDTTLSCKNTTLSCKDTTFRNDRS